MQCPPGPRPRPEGGVAEGLRRRRLDHLPGVQAHGGEAELQLVRQRDVDGAEDVLGELRRLRDLQRADRHRPLHHRAVEGEGEAERGRVGAGHQLRDGGGAEPRVARVLPLRRVGQEDVAADAQPPGLQDRRDHAARGARVGGGFQHHEPPGPELGRRGLRRGPDAAQVGLVPGPERRGDADQHRVGPRERLLRIRRGAQPSGREVTAQRPGREVRKGRLARVQARHLHRVHVEADGAEPGLGRRLRQRQADMPEPDHGEGGRPVGEPGG
jgi:hypothetical protein